MQARFYYFLRSIAFAALAIYSFAFPWISSAPIDSLGKNFSIGFGILFTLLSAYYFRKMRLTRATERAYQPPTDATPTEWSRYYNRAVALGLVGFVAMTIFTIHDLNLLESEERQSVSVWAPIKYVYEFAGYWAAVGVPVFGIMMTCIFWLALPLLKTRPRIAAYVSGPLMSDLKARGVMTVPQVLELSGVPNSFISRTNALIELGKLCINGTIVEEKMNNAAGDQTRIFRLSPKS